MKSSVNRNQTTKRKPSSTRKPSLSDLPPEQKYLSKDQFREIAQIGTRTATRLISSGLVPAIDTHMKTSRYLIAKTDVEKSISVIGKPILGNTVTPTAPVETLLFITGSHPIR